jgi:FixJ family two-component response regulator
VMSGAVDLEQRAAAMGAVAILTKPLDVEMLIEVVKRYCA